jgi:hypothetical protein
MGNALELKHIFENADDDPLTLESDAPDFFEQFRESAELAGVAGGFGHVEQLRRECAAVNQRANGIYKSIAAAAHKTETKRLSKSAPLQLFMRLSKIDEEQKLVYGVCASETPDRQDEVLDYEGSKPYFRAWSDSVRKDSGGVSLGNVREMHGMSAVGTLAEIEFNDSAKQIEVCVKVVDDRAWSKVLSRTYTGFSVGGRYVDVRKESNGLTRYIADPCEISFVDRPAVPDAVFQLVKAIGD